jgi:hypothetical protein
MEFSFRTSEQSVCISLSPLLPHLIDVGKLDGKERELLLLLLPGASRQGLEWSSISTKVYRNGKEGRKRNVTSAVISGTQLEANLEGER